MVLLQYAVVKYVVGPTDLHALWVHRQKAKLEMPRLKEEKL